MSKLTDRLKHITSFSDARHFNKALGSLLAEEIKKCLAAEPIEGLHLDSSKVLGNTLSIKFSAVTKQAYEKAAALIASVAGTKAQTDSFSDARTYTYRLDLKAEQLLKQAYGKISTLPNGPEKTALTAGFKYNGMAGSYR